LCMETPIDSFDLAFNEYRKYINQLLIK
jgi:hypothetical protein